MKFQSLFAAALGLCVLAPATVAVADSGDWYAIAKSTTSQSAARQLATRLGFGWSAVRTNQCPNMTPGLWITAAGPHSKAEAQAYAGGARDGANIRDAYVKECH